MSNFDEKIASFAREKARKEDEVHRQSEQAALFQRKLKLQEMERIQAQKRQCAPAMRVVISCLKEIMQTRLKGKHRRVELVVPTNGHWPFLGLFWGSYFKIDIADGTYVKDEIVVERDGWFGAERAFEILDYSMIEARFRFGDPYEVEIVTTDSFSKNVLISNHEGIQDVIAEAFVNAGRCGPYRKEITHQAWYQLSRRGK